MKRTPAFPPKFYHRVKFSSDSNMYEREMLRLRQMMEGHSTSPMVSTELAKKFRIGHGLVVASWNRWDDSCAKTDALGVVIGHHASGDPDVSWVLVQRELPRSYRPGKEKWDNPTVQLDPAVAGDFQLDKLFEEHRAELLAPIAREAK